MKNFSGSVMLFSGGGNVVIKENIQFYPQQIVWYHSNCNIHTVRNNRWGKYNN